MRNIVIIGGSKGIGNAVLTSEIDHNNLVNVSRESPSITHKNLSHYTCDILEGELPDLEKVDTLIYCPGSINLKPISRLTLDDFRSDFEINVIGAVKSIQKYLPKLKKGNNPSIVLFSSVATKLGMPFHASIATSKSGIEGLTKSLAAELAPIIRVNAIAPTVTNTSLAEKILKNDSMKEKMVTRHPLKMYLEPTDIANMVHFLISEKSKAISGQIFEVDAGIVNLKI